MVNSKFPLPSLNRERYAFFDTVCITFSDFSSHDHRMHYMHDQYVGYLCSTYCALWAFTFAISCCALQVRSFWASNLWPFQNFQSNCNYTSSVLYTNIYHWVKLQSVSIGYNIMYNKGRIRHTRVKSSGGHLCLSCTLPFGMVGLAGLHSYVANLQIPWQQQTEHLVKL